MTEQNRGGRPCGRHNIRPTRQEVAGYFELLRGAAQQGDIDAARHLIDLHDRHQRKDTAQ